MEQLDKLEAKCTAYQHKIILLEKSLEHEKEEVIKLKKCIGSLTKKNHHHHEFSTGPCIYLVQNPDSPEKVKYGMIGDHETSGINGRLRQYRTSMPEVKVRLIMYTLHSRKFEDMIRIKFEESLVRPAHEWIIESIDTIIQAVKDINISCGFKGILETDIHRYNLETASVKEVPSHGSDPIPENISITPHTLNQRIHNIIPAHLIRADLLKKNAEASAGQRYCNAWCQVYRPIESFLVHGSTTMTLCKDCQNIEDVAAIKIASGELTPEAIRNNPHLVILSSDEKICRSCNKILHESKFEHPKRKCRKCRYDKERIRVNRFELTLHKEIEILENLRSDKRELRLKGYIRDELIKIMKHLKTGRKSTDRKQDMITKLLAHSWPIQSKIIFT